MGTPMDFSEMPHPGAVSETEYRERLEAEIDAAYSLIAALIDGSEHAFSDDSETALLDPLFPCYAGQEQGTRARV